MGHFGEFIKGVSHAETGRQWLRGLQWEPGLDEHDLL